MDHLQILKRAWQILKQYRVLWIFGLILALTTASPSSQSAFQGGGGKNGDAPPTFQWDEGEFEREFEDVERWFTEGIPPQVVTTLIVVGIIIAVVGLALFIISRIARYVAETSLIRMVNIYEESGEQYTFRQGWRLGWSREAWRLFLINLVIDLPILAVFLLLLLIVAAPLLLWGSGNLLAGLVGTVSTIGFAFLLILFGIVIGTIVSLLKHFFRRVCVLEETSVGDAIRRGYRMVKQHWKNVGLMWLITVGINIAWPIVMIPVTLVFIIAGIIMGGIVGLVVRGLAGLLLAKGMAWVVAGIVGGPIFLLIVIVPLAFLGGLKAVFMSNVWTLTYRELNTLQTLEAEPIYPSEDALPA